MIDWNVAGRCIRALGGCFFVWVLALQLVGCNISSPVIDGSSVDASMDTMKDTSDVLADRSPDVAPSNAVCGDLILEVPAEECDDGNLDYEDGCDAFCDIEDGYICPVAGEPCTRPTSFTWDMDNQRQVLFPAPMAGEPVTALCAQDEYLTQFVVRAKDERVIDVRFRCSALEVPESGGRALLNTSPFGNDSLEFGKSTDNMTSGGSGFSAGSAGHIFSLRVSFGTGEGVTGLIYSKVQSEVVEGQVLHNSSTLDQRSYGDSRNAASHYTSACDPDELPYGLTGYVVDNNTPRAFVHRIGMMCTKVLLK